MERALHEARRPPGPARQYRWGVALAACAVLLAGPGLAQEAPTPAAAEAPPAVDPGVPPDYIIGPGDAINVFVWRNPELSVSVPVRPDGKISTPLVEDMVAVGKTPSQLARDMEAVLAEYIRNPQVNIIVTAPVSAFSRVTAIGQVGTPGSFAYREGMRVLDLVLAAGGLSQFAAGNRARLVRNEESGKRVEIKVRLKDLMEKGRLEDNVEVRPGDVLVVPEALF
jgi:polysaccharide export outer membrane protein